jgi:glycosyltransferase involved in cell wall biosynthesis
VVNQWLSKARSGKVALPAGDQFDNLPDDRQISLRCQKAGPLKLLFIGNVIRRKGLHLVLQALNRLPVETWQLDIAGSLSVDPGYAATLHHQAGRMKMGAQVIFHGTLSKADLSRLLWDSQVLVVPSSYEGYGIVYLEAMSFGVLPLASTAGAAQEIITHGQDGFLVDPQDAGGLAAIIQDLYQDREKLCRMSLAARQRFVLQPTWAQTTHTIRNFLISFLRDWNSHEKSRS